MGYFYLLGIRTLSVGKFTVDFSSKRECTRIVTGNNKLIPAAPCATGLFQPSRSITSL